MNSSSSNNRFSEGNMFPWTLVGSYFLGGSSSEVGQLAQPNPISACKPSATFFKMQVADSEALGQRPGNLNY